MIMPAPSLMKPKTLRIGKDNGNHSSPHSAPEVSIRQNTRASLKQNDCLSSQEISSLPSLENAHYGAVEHCVIIDTLEGVARAMQWISGQLDKETTLYIDMKGPALGRQGSISILTILLQPQRRLFAFDIFVMSKEAFSVTCVHGLSLANLLESTRISKTMFDARSCSDALFGLFGIQMRSVEELQLFELLARSSSRKYLNGLAQCVKKDPSLPLQDQAQWCMTRQLIRQSFLPSCGGNEGLYTERPLREELALYCIHDISVFHGLREHFRPLQTHEMRKKAREATAARIQNTFSKDYSGQGEHMKFGPFKECGKRIILYGHLYKSM